MKWIVALMVVCTSLTCLGRDYHLAANGNDANSGTQRKPFATLARARDAARQGDRVILHDGVYHLRETLVLGSAHSGVTWMTAPSAKPVISGGIVITGWTLVDAEKNVWSAKVGATDDFRQLYVNGKKALRTRSARNLRLRIAADGFQIETKNFQPPADMANLELVFRVRPWREDWCPVASIEGGNIHVAESCWQQIKTDQRPVSAFLANARDFMTSPGNWYLDHQAHTVYYIPRPGEEMTTAIVERPVLEQLVVLAGDAEHPVENVAFTGLTFRLSNWLQPGSSEGLVSGQANQVAKMFGAWSATGARNVKLSNCSFRDLGGIGVNFGKASQHCVVSRCEFTEIAAGAIQIGSVHDVADLPVDSPEIVADITIADCQIHHVGTEYRASCAIFAGYVGDCTIEHNEIHTVPYSAISLGWGWTSPGASYTRNNRIVGNKIHDHMQALEDGGAIYCNGYQENGLVARNYVYNQRHAYALLYLDDGATHWTVTSNVCQNSRKPVAWYLYKGRDNHAADNFTDNAFIYRRCTGPCTLERTTVVASGEAWPEAAQIIMNDSGVRPTANFRPARQIK